MLFTLHCKNEIEQKVFFYDNQNSELLDEDSLPVDVIPISYDYFSKRPYISTSTKTNIQTLKIQLGLNCNYECSYCSQRFSTRTHDKVDITKFLDMIDKADINTPKRIEFWGGEPLLYFDIVKKLTPELRNRFPEVQFMIINNGSLLTLDINNWLIDNDFAVAVSHDGPGQYLRGGDPLTNPTQKEIILSLYRALKEKGKFSFNCMISDKNPDRQAVQDYFINLTGDEDVNIGEGSYIKPSEGNLPESTEEEVFRNRRRDIEYIMGNFKKNFNIISLRMSDFINSLSFNRQAKSLGGTCNCESSDILTTTLDGKILTCQNVSACDLAPNGKPHHIGNLTNLDDVVVNTTTTLRDRTDCQVCPLLQVCKGNCNIIPVNILEFACSASFNDNIPFFAAGIQAVTGYMPIFIEDEDGFVYDIFGSINDNTLEV